MVTSTTFTDKKSSTQTYVVTLHGHDVEILCDEEGVFIIPPRLNVGTALKPSWEPILVGRKPE